ncbi:hypothetical protein AB833_14570 [Chromatiales bacterium (ex Bugula neritina AB1)]|nr:hypothetical protein AB833_14570 [Chromatiales bacterium (ex Bugula neritina AB1)]
MSLAAPVFLFGLFAAVLPWLLHRLSSENPPAQDFSSTMLLEQSETRSSRQTRLQYWKLLSLRLLFLLLLALLFAQPLWNSGRLIGGSAVRHVLLIDSSLSQSHEDRWDRTLRKATELLDAASTSDEAVVITAGSAFAQSGDSASDAATEPSIEAARDSLNQLLPGIDRLDYGRIASAVSATVKDSSLPVHLHLISDLQRSAMPEKFSSLAIDGLSGFTLYSTAGTEDSNIAISAKLDHAVDNNADISVIVQTYGETPANARVSVSDETTTLKTATIALSANASTVHQFSDIDSSTATGALTVRLELEDKLSADNQWIVAVPDGERTEIPVLSGNAVSNANTYVRAAIESDPRFKVRWINPDNLSAANVGPFLIVPDASSLGDRAVGRLRQYLNGGGNAVVIAGSSVHGPKIRQLLGIRTLSVRQSADRQSLDTQSRPVVAAVDTTHPVTAGLTANWRLLTILRNLPLNDNQADKQLVKLDNGEVLMAEKQYDQGKALLLASPVDTAWNNLAVDPLFVAFLIRSIEYLGANASSNSNRAVGDAISLPPGTQLLDPDGKPMREISELEERATVLLNRTGVYRLRSPSGSQLLSVNNDAREFELQTIDSETRNRWESIVSSKKNNTEAGTQRTQHKQINFWQWLLPLLALLALIESLYSHRHLRVRREA